MFGRMQNTVFMFEGIGGNYSKIYEIFNQGQQEQMKLYCQEAKDITGIDVLEHLQGIKEDRVNTAFTEWAFVYICNLIIFEHYVLNGIIPDICMGYSLGLNTALVCAKAINFKDGILLLDSIRKGLKDQVESGQGMAVISGLGRMDVIKIIEEIKGGEYVHIASENSEHCIVISGREEYINVVISEADKQGALKTKNLEIPFAFHFGEKCETMKEYFKVVKDLKIHEPNFDIYSIYTCKSLINTHQLREELDKNIWSQMRWKDAICNLECRGYKEFWDISPGGNIKKMTLLGRNESQLLTYKSFKRLPVVNTLPS